MVVAALMVIVGFALSPRFVVISITPLAPREPYTAVEAASFRI